MRIGIDIRWLGLLNDQAGLFQYIYNLVTHLLNIDSENEYVLFSSIKGFREEYRRPNCKIRRFPARFSTPLLESLGIPIDFFTGKINVFHGPVYFAPSSLFCKSIVTIHDLMVFTQPDFSNPELVAYLKKKICTSIKRAHLVLAVSNFTKGQIVDLFSIPENRIRVVYNGISSRFCPMNDEAEKNKVAAKYGFGKPYLLFVGNIEPKKNIENLIHAFLEFKKSTRTNYSLLIVGKKSWYFKRLWDVVVKLKAIGDVIFTDVVEQKDLPYLYGGAELFIFPSLFEGFGIPPLEAMACGTPVISSNITSIREVLGDAAVLVNPRVPDEISQAMVTTIFDNGLKKALREAGFERARMFSWKKTAKETLRLYNDVV